MGKKKKKREKKYREMKEWYLWENFKDISKGLAVAAVTVIVLSFLVGVVIGGALVTLYYNMK